MILKQLKNNLNVLTCASLNKTSLPILELFHATVVSSLLNFEIGRKIYHFRILEAKRNAHTPQERQDSNE